MSRCVLNAVEYKLLVYRIERLMKHAEPESMDRAFANYQCSALARFEMGR